MLCVCSCGIIYASMCKCDMERYSVSMIYFKILMHFNQFNLLLSNDMTFSRFYVFHLLLCTNLYKIFISVYDFVVVHFCNLSVLSSRDSSPKNEKVLLIFGPTGY